MWLYVVALLILCVIVVLLVGKWEGAAAPREEPPAGGPSAVDHLLTERAEQGLSAADLDRVEFDTGVRGYRMDQVDQLLDALAEQLRGSAAVNGGSGKRERRDIPPE
jgi:DivIVA domain-containing protein